MYLWVEAGDEAVPAPDLTFLESPLPANPGQFAGC
jgi:hypothetical protein